MTNSSERARRVARNEHVWREANAAIENAVSNFAGETAHDRFLCECARPDCQQMVHVHLPDMRRARETSTTFVVAPGHVVEEFESVCEKHDSWWMVQKNGAAAVEAIALDNEPS